MAKVCKWAEGKTDISVIYGPHGRVRIFRYAGRPEYHAQAFHKGRHAPYESASFPCQSWADTWAIQRI